VPIAGENGKPQATIIRSVRLGNLKAGDQIRVDAMSKTAIGALNYNALITSNVFVATGPRKVTGTGTGGFVDPSSAVDELNGFNCTQGRSAHRTPCYRPKLGVVRIERDVRTAYINLMVSGRAMLNESNPHAWHRGDHGIAKDSYLRAWVYRND
jgi:hypothetical protein